MVPKNVLNFEDASFNFEYQVTRLQAGVDWMSGITTGVAASGNFQKEKERMEFRGKIP